MNKMELYFDFEKERWAEVSLTKRQNLDGCGNLSWFLGRRLPGERSGVGQVDEVKVFGCFGGDLPVQAQCRKLKGKKQRATGLTRLQHHPNRMY
jgi:hypothetical protein